MKQYVVIYDNKLRKFDEVKKLEGKKDLSVVIPTYNEECNVIPLIQEITNSLKTGVAKGRE